MAADFFLKIDGIDGESKDNKHAKEIEVLSFAFGGNNSGTAAFAGGMGAGKVNIQDFHFTMRVNKASPKLQLVLWGGDHIGKAVLTCRKAGKDQQEFLVYTFTDLMVSHHQISGNGQDNEIPIENISLNFSKVEVSYKEQKQDGTLAAEVKSGWNLKTNTKT